MEHYFLIYKPYLTISQFTPEGPDDKTLSDLGFEFPKDCYSVGRLDKDSEGLLLITNDNFLKSRFLNPANNHQKTYYAQVEGVFDNAALDRLEKGVEISINGTKYVTMPAKVKKILNTPDFPTRNPPIRYRAEIPTSWVSITIGEGKNRQVRKMCAAVGFPVLRLVRFAMESLTVADLNDEKVRSLDKKTIYEKLKLS
ncbi:MAG: pseudouridine synthase [Saprospiraceae bacterium]